MIARVAMLVVVAVLCWVVGGRTCIQESSKRTGTGEVTISDVGALYTEAITSEHRLAKIDVMTSRSGELNGIQLTLSTYSDSGAVRLSDEVALNVFGGNGSGSLALWLQHDEYVQTLIISYTIS